jgi:hypothetical protein
VLPKRLEDSDCRRLLLLLSPPLPLYKEADLKLSLDGR